MGYTVCQDGDNGSPPSQGEPIMFTVSGTVVKRLQSRLDTERYAEYPFAMQTDPTAPGSNLVRRMIGGYRDEMRHMVVTLLDLRGFDYKNAADCDVSMESLHKLLAEWQERKAHIEAQVAPMPRYTKQAERKGRIAAVAFAIIQLEMLIYTLEAYS